MDRAFETAPLSPVVNLSLAARSYYARQFPEAVEQSQKTLALDQAFVPAHTLLARVYTQQRSQKQALTEFKKALEISGAVPTSWLPWGTDMRRLARTPTRRKCWTSSRTARSRLMSSRSARPVSILPWAKRTRRWTGSRRRSTTAPPVWCT